MGQNHKLIRSKAFALYALPETCTIQFVKNPGDGHKTVGTERPVTCCAIKDIMMQIRYLPSVRQLKFAGQSTMIGRCS